jgi:hypothetical protein
MIVATRRKLDEARFFYGHLVTERQRASTHDPREFRFYFSAFIQAARSVTWTLGNEEPEKWKAWEPKWKDTRSNEEHKHWTSRTNSGLMRLSAAEPMRWWNGKK